MKKMMTGIFGCFVLLLFSAVALTAPVPDTGQAKYYKNTFEIPCPSSDQPFYGQDANYTINLMFYSRLDGSGNPSNKMKHGPYTYWTTQDSDVRVESSMHLPNGFIGIFFPLTPMEAERTERQVKTAKSYGIEVVALVVHWKDIEPSENKYDFDQLKNLINIIKSYGMYAVLRVYFNGGPMDEASPSWLFENYLKVKNEDYYTILSQRDKVSIYRQPLPWSSPYIAKVDKLLKDMTQYFATQATVLPDAIQMSVGGDYGEQWLNAPDISLDYETFVEKLLNAAKQHVDIFQNYFSPLHIDTTLMAGSLLDGNPPQNYELIDYSLSQGVKWVQTNANASKLQACKWGLTTMKMFSPYIHGRMSFAIEEEGGADGVVGDVGGKCPSIDPENVATRLNRIKQLETDNGFRFQGVYLKGYAAGNPDMSEGNRQGILNLIKHVKNQSSSTMCDFNGDGNVDIVDAILCLQVLGGLVPNNINPAADVDGDGKIGMAEAICILQFVSGLW